MRLACEAHDEAADDPTADIRLARSVHRTLSARRRAGRLPLREDSDRSRRGERAEQHDRALRQRGNALEDLVDGEIAHVLDGDSPIAVDVELTARGGLPHAVGRGGSRDHDHAACAGLKTKRGLEGPRPIDVQPDAGDIAVELEIAEGGAIDAAEHDRRARKEIGAIRDREPHRATGERRDQVGLTP